MKGKKRYQDWNIFLFEKWQNAGTDEYSDEELNPLLIEVKEVRRILSELVNEVEFESGDLYCKKCKSGGVMIATSTKQDPYFICLPCKFWHVFGEEK